MPGLASRWAAVVTLAAAVAIDLLYGKDASLVVTLVFEPFVASALASARKTAVMASGATALSVLLGWPDGTWGTSAHVVRVVAVAVGGALAVWLAARRTNREAKLRALSRVADAAQQAILHPLPAQLDGHGLAGRYVSAAAEAHVGGDFHAVTSTPWGMRLVVGDVRGKGPDAVRLASVLLGEFRSRAATEPDMAVLAGLVDAAGSRHVDASGEDFATAVFGQFRDGVVTTVRCGHPFPLMAATGAVMPLRTAPSLPLCLGGVPVAQTRLLAPGARVLYYSDGAVEGRDHLGREFDLDRCLARHAGGPSLDAVLDGILGDVRRHCAEGIDDDVVLVLVEDRRERADD